jgi:hypothetical protein
MIDSQILRAKFLSISSSTVVRSLVTHQNSIEPYAARRQHERGKAAWLSICRAFCATNNDTLGRMFGAQLLVHDFIRSSQSRGGCEWKLCCLDRASDRRRRRTGSPPGVGRHDRLMGWSEPGAPGFTGS